MSSHQHILGLPLLVCVLACLSTGVALELRGSLTSQSTTHSDPFVAGKAVDGILTTTAVTDYTPNPWWKVDLGDTYCLTKITLTNRNEYYNDRNFNAVSRAGLSTEHLQNAMIGSPITQSQAGVGKTVDFNVDPIVIARYVSFDIPSELVRRLQIAEITVEEITESENENTGSIMFADIGLDFTLVTNIPLIGQTGDNEAAITVYKGCSDLTANVSFGRQLTAGGANTGLPTGSRVVGDPKLGRAVKSLKLPEAGGIDRVGVFYSQLTKGGRSTRIQTILLHKDDGGVNIVPEQRTLTVNVGELVTLTMVPSQTNVNVRWKHNEDAMDGWDNQLTLSISSVVKSNEGIYSCFVDGQENQQRHGIMRLIVRACPSGMWGPVCSDECNICNNGGICDDHTGTCVCAPGFSGDTCENVHGRYVFGKDAQYGCSDSQGQLFCLPDPYGCSCSAGYMGLDCMQECEDGWYGADCKQTCQCQDDETCLKDTGQCINGGGGEWSSTTYSGNSCQCSKIPVLGLRVTSDDPHSLMISWEHDQCVSSYSLTYVLTNRGQCEEISSPVNISVPDPSRGQTSHTLLGLVPLSTYMVYMKPLNQGTLGTESSVSGITLDVTDPEPVALSVTAISSSQIQVEWEPVCAAIDYKVDYVLKTLEGCEAYGISPSSVYTSHPDCPCSSSSVSISGLNASSTYIVRVQVRVVDSSSYGQEATMEVTTSMSEPTAAPTDVLNSAETDTSLSFSWSEPSCGGRGGIITGYTYKLTQVGSMPDDVVGPSDTSSKIVTIPDLIPYTDYSFQVAARTNIGTGPFSSSLNARTEEGVPPAPIDFKVKSADENSITVEWTEPDPPHGVIINYDISYWPSMEDETSATITTNVGVRSLSYRIEGLMTNVNYFIKVRAKTSAGTGVWSVAVSSTTQIGVPGPVENLRSTDQTDMSITLEWDPPVNPNGQIMKYMVEYRAVEKRHQVDFTADTAYMNKEHGDELWDIITNLEPTTKYGFKISAQNQLFTSDAAVLEVYTKPLENPPSPPAPRIDPNDVTDTTVTINLSRVPDDVYITSYVIHVKKTESKTKRESLDPIHHNDSPDNYIAAELFKEMVQDSFVVGDGLMYGGYHNAPLDTGATYNIRVGSVSRGNGTDASVTYSEAITSTIRPIATGSPLVAPVIILGLIVLLVVPILIIVCLKWRKDRSDLLVASNAPSKGLDLNQLVIANQPPTVIHLNDDKDIYEDIGLPRWAVNWEIKWNQLIVEDTILGKGNFGEVRLGGVKMEGKVTKAAVKMLKGGSPKNAAEDFLKEFQTMTLIKAHPNVVGLLGASFNEGVLYVALEFVPGDNLRKYLRKNRQIQLQREQSKYKASPVTMSQLLKFGEDVAKGMQHLSDAGIIHRDLAARNILLGEELTAKVSDFGLSRGEDVYVQESKTRIPVRWLAIESLTHRRYISKSDVWSFGILLWEIVTFGGTPYPGIQTRNLADYLLDGNRMPQPENCPDDIYALMLKCWRKTPKNRPSFKEITEELEKIRHAPVDNANMLSAVYENFSVIKPEFDDN